MQTKQRQNILAAAITLFAAMLLTIASPGYQIKANAQQSFLKASGNKIVNENGNEVILRGVNLGGWLIQEYWMCPVKGLDSVSQWTHMDTVDTLVPRFGEDKARELMYTYEENWITSWDIQNIASMGYNAVRVPFGFFNFMSDSDGGWTVEDPGSNHGFKMLDWVIEEAEKNGIYVILDMHGCPGGQSGQHCDGYKKKRLLYDDEKYQDAMESLWTAIAERYKGNPTVAMYDIMNEPLLKTAAASVETDARNIIYDRMIRVIRDVDPDHMIAVEGIWSIDKLPYPEKAGWENVVYELHLYNMSNPGVACKSLATYGEQHNVPVYIGEYSDTAIRTAAEKYGVSYTSWTYKGSVESDGTWFMYYSSSIDQADISYGSYNEIKSAWGSKLNTNSKTWYGKSRWTKSDWADRPTS